MVNKPNSFSVLLFCLFLLSCSNNKQSVKFDLNRDTSIVLRKSIGQSFIWHLKIQIIDKTDDSTEMIISDFENVVYKRIILNGTDSIYNGDWYLDSVLIKFVNVRKPSRNIELKYLFVD